VILLAWFGILIAPCSLAAAPPWQGSDAIAVTGMHEHCPDDQATNLSLAPDCCCDQAIVLSAEALKPFKLMTMVVPPSSMDFTSPDLFQEERGILSEPPLGQTPLPVYLATQRLRI